MTHPMRYASEIKETLEQLLHLEKQQRQARLRDRIRFLRLLKEGQAQTQQQAGKQLGLSLRQSQRIWQTYRQQGIEQLLQTGYQHGFGKLNTQQINDLQVWLSENSVQTLSQIQAFIKERWQVEYTIAGLSLLFKRMKIKYKSVRPDKSKKVLSKIDTKTLQN
jgi:transposase